MSEETKTNLPSPRRVAERSLVLCTTSCRASLEDDSGEEVRTFYRDLREWSVRFGLMDEMESDEFDLVKTPLGGLPERNKIDASWRIEGASVLAWALHQTDIPPYDTQVNPRDIADSLGFMSDDVAKLLEMPLLRPIGELEQFNRQMLTLHWRLRQFALDQKGMDFRSVAGNGEFFSQFDYEYIRLAGEDLEVCGAPIDQAKPDDVSMLTSIAMERHQASRWLMGWEENYSDVTTDT